MGRRESACVVGLLCVRVGKVCIGHTVLIDQPPSAVNLSGRTFCRTGRKLGGAGWRGKGGSDKGCRDGDEVGELHGG